MPPKNFGKTSTTKGDKDKDSRNVDSRDRVSDIEVINSYPEDEKNVVINFRAFIKKESKSTVFLQILTQDTKMDETSWKKTMGERNEFPFSLQNLFLNKCDDEEIGELINSDYKSSLFDLKIINNVVEITSKVPMPIIIEGTIYMNISSNQYLPNIAIRSENIKEAIDE